MDCAVIGGGIAGLYAALELQEQGHNVTLFESGRRLGGRIHTYRFKKQHEGDDPFFEAGAMRLPLSSFHSSVFDFIRYLNDRTGSSKDKIELLPFVLQHPNNKLLIEGHARKTGDTKLAAEFGLPERYHNRCAADILLEVMQPWIDLLRSDPQRGIEEVLKHDDMTFRHYLRTAGMPSDVIDFVELIQSQTNQFENGFVDLTIQTLHFNTPEWVTINGGLSKIIDTAANQLGYSNIHLNSPVRAITEQDGRPVLSIGAAREYQKSFDKVLFAIPPAAIQKLRSRPKWSLLKEQAIRSTHEGPLYKMGIHFRRRFWETDVPEPSLGGQDQTDYRIRWVVFPSQEIGSDNSGCLVAYCGMTDALRWGWMDKEHRLKLVLEDLDRVFKPQGVNIYEEYIDFFDARWPSEEAFSNTMYLPGQFSRFHEAMAQPEGNVYFAGEHLSFHHTWVTGSTDTAHDAVKLMVGDSTLKRLADTSHLEGKSVCHGVQVAAGIAFAQGTSPVSSPQDSPLSAPVEKNDSSVACKDLIDALPALTPILKSIPTRNSSVDSAIGMKENTPALTTAQ